MASILSLSRPLGPSPSSSCSSPPLSTSHHSIRFSIASERPVSMTRCNAVTPDAILRDTCSSRNVGSEFRRPVRCSASEAPSQGDDGCCEASGSGIGGVEEDCGMSILSFSSSWRRRDALGGLIAMGFFGAVGKAEARDRRNRKEVAAEDYLTSSSGVKYYDLEQGKGPVAELGETVSVHFDCVYRSITAVSSRESKLLAGNRTIAQPYEFIVGAEPGKERKREYVDSANGLFSAQASPKPPPALYNITEGMRVGGKRTVIVTPEIGYGKKGLNEIPPDATFEMNVELLEVKKPQINSSK